MPNRGSIIRNKSFATLGTLALLAAASAFGQQRHEFDIPFEFHFANTVMPAGHYEVITSGSHSLLVHCYTCRISRLSPTIAIGGGPKTNTESRLVFDKYGDTYLLAQMWSPGSAFGIGLNKSKTEREIARTAPYVARIHTGSNERGRAWRALIAGGAGIAAGMPPSLLVCVGSPDSRATISRLEHFQS